MRAYTQVRACVVVVWVQCVVVVVVVVVVAAAVAVAAVVEFPEAAAAASGPPWLSPSPALVATWPHSEPLPACLHPRRPPSKHAQPPTPPPPAAAAGGEDVPQAWLLRHGRHERHDSHQERRSRQPGAVCFVRSGAGCGVVWCGVAWGVLSLCGCRASVVLMAAAAAALGPCCHPPRPGNTPQLPCLGAFAAVPCPAAAAHPLMAPLPPLPCPAGGDGQGAGRQAAGGAGWARRHLGSTPRPHPHRKGGEGGPGGRGWHGMAAWGGRRREGRLAAQRRCRLRLGALHAPLPAANTRKKLAAGSRCRPCGCQSLPPPPFARPPASCRQRFYPPPHTHKYTHTCTHTHTPPPPPCRCLTST